MGVTTITFRTGSGCLSGAKPRNGAVGRHWLRLRSANSIITPPILATSQCWFSLVQSFDRAASALNARESSRRGDGRPSQDRASLHSIRCPNAATSLSSERSRSPALSSQSTDASCVDEVVRMRLLRIAASSYVHADREQVRRFPPCVCGQIPHCANPHMRRAYLHEAGRCAGAAHESKTIVAALRTTVEPFGRLSFRWHAGCSVICTSIGRGALFDGRTDGPRQSKCEGVKG